MTNSCHYSPLKNPTERKIVTFGSGDLDLGDVAKLPRSCGLMNIMYAYHVTRFQKMAKADGETW